MTWDIAGWERSPATAPPRRRSSTRSARAATAEDRSRSSTTTSTVPGTPTRSPTGPAPGVDEPGRATRWLITAIDQALADAGHPRDLAEVPVLVGTTLQEQRSAELWWRHGTALDPADLHFGTALREEYGAARTYTFANACAASSLRPRPRHRPARPRRRPTPSWWPAPTPSRESAYGAARPRLPGTTCPDRAAPLRPRPPRHAAWARAPSPSYCARRPPRPDPGPRSTPGCAPSRVNCDAQHSTRRPTRRASPAAVRDALPAGPAPRSADIDLVMLHGTRHPAQRRRRGRRALRLGPRRESGRPRA
ncbi:hypothetical protein SMICM17S_01338 [Streptomyces microflavus]